MTFILSNPTPFFFEILLSVKHHATEASALGFSWFRPLIVQLPVFPSDEEKAGQVKGESGQREGTWLVIERRN